MGIGFVRNQVRNRLGFLLLFSGLRRRLKIRFRNTPDNIEVDIDERTFTVFSQKKKIKLRFPPGRIQMLKSLISVYEVYVGEIYRYLPVKDKIVVDIGAGIGDSSIYFANCGASHVYAFEPLMPEFSIALENINSMEVPDNVTIYSEPIVQSKSSGKGSGLSIDQFVKQVHLDDASIKIDCEGCEFSLLEPNATDWLRYFQYMILEYHGVKDALAEVLESSGFRVAFPQPHISPEISPNRMWYSGLIFAERIEDPEIKDG